MRLRRSDPAKPGLRRVRRGSGFAFLDAEGRRWTPPPRSGFCRSSSRRLGRTSGSARSPTATSRPSGPTPPGGDSTSTTRPGTRPATATSTTACSRSPGASRRREPRSAGGSDGTGWVASGSARWPCGCSTRASSGPGARSTRARTAATASPLSCKDHVTVSGEVVSFYFPAKSGVEREADVRDPALAKAVSALKRSRGPSERLLQYRDRDVWCELTLDGHQHGLQGARRGGVHRQGPAHLGGHRARGGGLRRAGRRAAPDVRTRSEESWSRRS